jgi:hypothetical protein
MSTKKKKKKMKYTKYLNLNCVGEQVVVKLKPDAETKEGVLSLVLDDAIIISASPLFKPLLIPLSEIMRIVLPQEKND